MKGSRNMYEKRMRGVVIPTITPMMPDGTVDEQSVENFTEYLIQAGANCLSQRHQWRKLASDGGRKRSNRANHGREE